MQQTENQSELTRAVEGFTTADGTPLAVSLKRAERFKRFWALALALPLLLFILISYIFPIADVSLNAFRNPEINTYLPNFSKEIKSWDESANALPDERVFDIFIQDLKNAKKEKNLGKVATRLNYAQSGLRGLVNGTARKLRRLKNYDSAKDALIKINKDWADVGIWKIIKRESKPYTFSYVLAALDLRFNEDGDIVKAPEHLQIYIPLLIKTLWISLAITFSCALLGYPVAYMLASLPMRTSNLLMIMVLLPFWTSLLVRTTTWIVILQQQGVLNDILVWLGVVSEDGRLAMMHNLTGTIVAMTHILLPFMILPLYSVMKTIPPSYVRAARSLGANQFVAYVRVYMPQTLSGIGAGSLLVFILSVGYYITPALVGGQDGQLISNMVAYHMQTSLNWGLAAAIGTILLVIVLVFYSIYNRYVGIEKIKMG